MRQISESVDNSKKNLKMRLYLGVEKVENLHIDILF